jgi:hypothetical protein
VNNSNSPTSEAAGNDAGLCSSTIFGTKPLSNDNTGFDFGIGQR